MRETIEKHRQRIIKHKQAITDYEKYVRKVLQIFLRKQGLYEETDYYISIISYYQIRLKSLSTEFIKKYPTFEAELNRKMDCKGNLELKNERLIFKYYSLIGENMDSFLDAKFTDKKVE